MAWSRNLEWNTDLIETAELEDLIGQTSQCMHSGKEHHKSQGGHAQELPEVRRCTEDEAHDLTIECQACGGCKGCVAVPRGSHAERSHCQPDRPIVVASGGVLRYTHIPTLLDDSTTLDDCTHSTLHNPQRAGALVTSIILDGGPHGWVCTPKVGGGCG